MNKMFKIGGGTRARSKIREPDTRPRWTRGRTYGSLAKASVGSVGPAQ